MCRQLNPVSPHPPEYFSVVRPVREILCAIPGHRRDCFEASLAPRHRRAASNTMDEADQTAVSQGRAVNRLATIMNLPPLRAAFGEFCRKALCSEVCMLVNKQTPTIKLVSYQWFRLG